MNMKMMEVETSLESPGVSIKLWYVNCKYEKSSQIFLRATSDLTNTGGISRVTCWEKAEVVFR